MTAQEDRRLRQEAQAAQRQEEARSRRQAARPRAVAPLVYPWAVLGDDGVTGVVTPQAGRPLHVIIQLMGWDTATKR